MTKARGRVREHRHEPSETRRARGRSTQSLWRNHDFVILWSGQVASVLGSRITATALPLLVLAVTGSPPDAGIVAAVGSPPHLVFFFPAGAPGGRWAPRRLLLARPLGARGPPGNRSG